MKGIFSKRKGIMATVLLLALVALLMTSCSESSQNDETVGITLSLPASSRDLTYTTETYDTISTDDYYWTYKAVKDDKLFKTGETEETFLQTDESGVPQKGLPTESFGAFSLGQWKFYFNAYTTSNDVTSETTISDLTCAFKAVESSNTLTKTQTSVTVTVSKYIDDSAVGTVILKDIYFKTNVSDTDAIEGYDTDTLYVYISTESGKGPEEIDSSGSTFVNDSNKAMLPSGSGFTASENVPVGINYVTVYYNTESYGVLAKAEIAVYVREGKTTTITGTITDTSSTVITLETVETTDSDGNSTILVKVYETITEDYKVTLSDDNITALSGDATFVVSEADNTATITLGASYSSDTGVALSSFDGEISEKSVTLTFSEGAITSACFDSTTAMSDEDNDGTWSITLYGITFTVSASDVSGYTTLTITFSATVAIDSGNSTVTVTPVVSTSSAS